jgi:hypothetical protein
VVPAGARNLCGRKEAQGIDGITRPRTSAGPTTHGHAPDGSAAAPIHRYVRRPVLT